jgi:hypothetical protein
VWNRNRTYTTRCDPLVLPLHYPTICDYSLGSFVTFYVNGEASPTNITGVGCPTTTSPKRQFLSPLNWINGLTPCGLSFKCAPRLLSSWTLLRTLPVNLPVLEADPFVPFLLGSILRSDVRRYTIVNRMFRTIQTQVNYSWVLSGELDSNQQITVPISFCIAELNL